MHGWQANTERTCAQPVVFRAMPEDEKPPAMRADFYYPLRKQWYIITARSAVYIISRRLYSALAMMIYNSYGIDDIQHFVLVIYKAYALICLQKRDILFSSSVYANIREANYGQSKADMLSKFEIALKECSETEGWLQLLFNTNAIDEEIYEKHRNLCGRIRRMLIASCKTLKENAK